MFLTLIVHPIDHDRHPSIPPGWRWAVMFDTDNPLQIERCLNAGWAPSADAARLDGDSNGATATVLARLLTQQPVELKRLPLDHDPIPADETRTRVV